MANLNIKVSKVIEQFYNVKKSDSIGGLYEVRDKANSDGQVLWYFFSSNNATYHSSGNDCVVRDIAQSNSSYIDRLKEAFNKAKEENIKIFWLVMVYGDGIGLPPDDYKWMASIEMKVDFDSMTKSLSMRTHPTSKWSPCLKRIDQDKYFNCTFICCKDANGNFTSDFMSPYFAIYDNRPFHDVIPNYDEPMEDNVKYINCLDIKREERKNIVHPLNRIIYGAPGTGKTYSMIEYALATLENTKLEIFRQNNPNRKSNVAKYKEMVRLDRVVFTTFHQNYGYEDFIEGLRPDKNSDKLAFKTVNGIFKKVALTAISDFENNYVIIIDEINRANISKVFGELITLIEDDKRWGEINEMSTVLPSKENFAVPNNLYIIGTMNSADKSISLIDAALRRRFHFIEQKPDSSLVEDPVLCSVLETLNESLIEELKSTDLLIGHSYFMNKNKDALCSILNENIIPLLYEYFFDDKNKVLKVLDNVIEKTDATIEIEDSRIGRIFVSVKGE